ncbi:MAG TPA: hypothetical protein VK841_03770 [Polyangiaceae bacterium]|jgi:hypothetical protein|nr:hypothetical protein [Polyangiaceae bacterium]
MSSKFASPLLGYNNNVRHKGRVFHIQTEDSGAKYGHVITHLFMDGGRILKSVKSSYAEHVGTERMAEVVRDLMKKQHKAMAVSLREGTFDRIAFGNAAASQETVAIASSASTMRSTVPPASARAETIPVAAPMAHASAVAAASSCPSSRPWRTSAIPSAGHGSERSRVMRAAPEALDIGFPERAPSAPARPEAVPHRSSVDTQAAHLLRERTAMGTYRLTPRPMESVAASSAPPAMAKAAISSFGFGGGGSQPAGASVRAVTTSRPASAFGQARPQGQSIFGEDLMSDKSLDEVILTYLAAELEGEKK